MTEPSDSRPPRLVPDRPFPPYAYIPGRNAHPTRDPEGHSYAAVPEVPEPPDPAAWRDCRDYLYGIDLFNHAFYWEAHEAWEGLWVACGRHGPTATYLQALINLAAAGFKARWGNAPGMRANAQTALRLFRAVEKHLAPTTERYMGLDIAKLADSAVALSTSTEPTATAPSDDRSLTFDVLLRPE